MIAALRRWLEEMKQLAAKDQELRGKQREIDRLYGKLAAASPSPMPSCVKLFKKCSNAWQVWKRKPQSATRPMGGKGNILREG